MQFAALHESLHGTWRTCWRVARMSAFESEADIAMSAWTYQVYEYTP